MTAAERALKRIENDLVIFKMFSENLIDAYKFATTILKEEISKDKIKEQDDGK